MASWLPRIFLNGLAFSVALAAAQPAPATPVKGHVSSHDGNGLADAVVTATPIAAPTAKPLSGEGRPTLSIDQQGREFIPHVLAIRSGSSVIFPNSDDIQHHVYSFSKAKRFEIKLYKNLPKNPVVFDQPGVVAIGCNIHDWMLGYVYVTDTPYFGKTDANGDWALDLPEGDYQLQLWHPDASNASELPNERLQMPATQKTLQHRIAIKARAQTGKPPSNLQIQDYSNDF